MRSAHRQDPERFDAPDPLPPHRTAVNAADVRAAVERLRATGIFSVRDYPNALPMPMLCEQARDGFFQILDWLREQIEAAETTTSRTDR